LRPDFDPVRHKGLGLSIVDTLTQQDLRGMLALRPNPASGGAVVTLRFPLTRDESLRENEE